MTMGGSDKVEESQYDKQLAVIAKQKWQDYQTTYKPVENAYRERILQMGGATERARMAGYTASAVQQELGGGLASAQGQLSAPRALAELSNRDLGRGNASGLGTAGADVQGTARKHAGIENIIAMGRQIENSGIQGLSNMAALDTSRSYAKAQADQIERAGMYDAVGTGVGYGLYKWKNREPTSAYSDEYDIDQEKLGSLDQYK